MYTCSHGVRLNNYKVCKQADGNCQTANVYASGYTGR